MSVQKKFDKREYHKLWMRRWRQKQRAKFGDRRKKNGKNQIRSADGKFGPAKDDIYMGADFFKEE